MKRMMFIAAAFAALVSCSKSETSQNPSTEPGTEETPAAVEYAFTEGQTVTITAGASLTKVSSALNSDGETVDFKWQSGDKILVNVGDKSSEFTVSKLKDDGASAEFTGKMPASGTTFSVQYPVEDPDLTSQTYTSDEAIPHDAMKFTATGCTVEEPFTLTAQYAALRLNLYGTDQTVGKIVVTNTTSTEATKPSYTLNISGGKELSTESSNPTSFFIVVNPENDLWNFKAEIFDGSSASICSFETTNPKKFTANQILNMSAKKVGKFYPGTELEGIKIGAVTWAPVNCGYDADHTYGLLYQWGRKYGQAYETGEITPKTLTKEQGEDSDNSDKFGKYNEDDYNWFSGGVDNTLWNKTLWNGRSWNSSKGTYDPCPDGWRVPTEAELNALISNKAWGINEVGTKSQVGYWFNGSSAASENFGVFLPAAGYRYYYGLVYNRGTKGYYWSSSVRENSSCDLDFGDSNARMLYGDRANGCSVRCVQE